MLNNNLYKLMNNPSIKKAMDLYSNPVIQKSLETYSNSSLEQMLKHAHKQSKLLNYSNNYTLYNPTFIQHIEQYTDIISKCQHYLKSSSSIQKILNHSVNHLDYSQIENHLTLLKIFDDNILLEDALADIPQSAPIQLEITNINTDALYLELAQTTNYQALPSSTKVQLQNLVLFVLIWIRNISAAVCINVIANLVTTELQKNIPFLQINHENTYKAIQTLPDLKKLLIQQNIRLTTADILHLRDNPNTHSHILEELPKNTLVKVLDKSQRSWLFVEVEINGNIEQGWIYRRYTAYFK